MSAVVATETSGWSEIGLSPELATHVQGLGFPDPTALQATLLPAVFDEVNVLMETPAGTGRTLAIAMIVAELVRDCEPGDSAVALIITSDDSRCTAIADELMRCGSAVQRSGGSGMRSVIVSDLGPADAQGRQLAQPLDVIVGTPERLSHLLAADHLDLTTIEMVVADQADDIVVGEQGAALTALLDGIAPDRQRIVLAGALLSPLHDTLEGHLNEPTRPQPPVPEPRRSTVSQQAFAVTAPGPADVATLIRAVGSEHAVVVVPSAGVENYRRGFDRANLSTTVTTASSLTDLSDVPAGSSIICTELPTWSDRYLQLLATAERLDAREILLLSAPGHRHLLRTLGRAAGVQLNAEPFPSPEGVAIRQLERTEQLVADQLLRVSAQPTPRFLSAVQRLSATYDVADIAAAAMEVAHRSLQRELEPGADTPLLLRGIAKPAANDRRQAPPPDPNSNRRKGGDRRGKETEEGMTRLFVAAGYNFGVRPGDIVGAFAGESGLSGKEIGNIDIRESFTLVEVPENLADDVITAMETGTIKGRQIEVRRERY